MTSGRRRCAPGRRSAVLLSRSMMYSIERAGREAELEARVRERTSELETALEDLQAYAFAITHDLRTSLRGIGGLAELVQQDQKDRLDDRGRDYLKRIETAAQTMDRVIEDPNHPISRRTCPWGAIPVNTR